MRSSADAPGADAFVIVGDSIRDIRAADIAALRSDDQGSRVRAAVDRAASLGRPLVLLTDGEVDDAEALAEAPAGSIVRVLANAAYPIAAIDVAAARRAIDAASERLKGMSTDDPRFGVETATVRREQARIASATAARA